MWSFLSGCVINPLRYPTRRGVARTGLRGVSNSCKCKWRGPYCTSNFHVIMLLPGMEGGGGGPPPPQYATDTCLRHGNAPPQTKPEQSKRTHTPEPYNRNGYQDCTPELLNYYSVPITITITQIMWRSYYYYSDNVTVLLLLLLLR